MVAPPAASIIAGRLSLNQEKGFNSHLIRKKADAKYSRIEGIKRTISMTSLLCGNKSCGLHCIKLGREARDMGSRLPSFREPSSNCLLAVYHVRPYLQLDGDA